MMRARFVVALVVAVVEARSLGAQSARIEHTLRPDGPLRSAAAQLLVTLDVTQAQPGASLTILAPSGFVVREIRTSTPAGRAGPPAGNTIRVVLGNVQGRVMKSFMIDPPSRPIPKGKYRLVTSLVTGPPNVEDSSTVAAGETVLAQNTLDIDYVPEIPIMRYLGLGLVGILLGYAIRLLVKVLEGITPPIPFAQNDGPITRFVKKHYYLVDCSVTLVIGLFVLLYLIKDGHVPDSAAYWYGALVTGVGLGLLTNSELIVKLPR